MLTVAVLGPVELRLDGEVLPVPSGLISDLLVRLALDAGRPVRAERLIEELWPGNAVATARNTLQSKVSGLRRALPDRDLLSSDAAGYTLRIDPAAVDALEALRLAELIVAQRDADDVHRLIATGAAGLALFRGEILTETQDAEWVQPHRARLEEARLVLAEGLISARLRLGASSELIGELESLVAAHPLREQLWCLLVLALYRAGRQADALAAIARVTAMLADDLGLDPGPELRRLEQQVLRQDPELLPSADPGSRSGSASGSGLGSVLRPAGNLPGLAGSIVGRDDELADVQDQLRDQRLVTVSGPAGVGKTRLAIEVARSVSLGADAPAGGVWLARLETATDAETCWQAIGAALRLAETTPAAVLERFSSVPALLVLDNCEQIAAIVPAVLDEILGAAQGLRVLATSQVPLAVEGETVFSLAPLDLADAVSLFHARSSPRAARTQQPDVIEQICRSLDGLPLAIELAAARTKALSPEEIARRLEDRFGLLTDPASRRPARQRTLSAAIGWSYDLLFPDDQLGVQALSCFAGGAPLTAAEHVLTRLGVPEAAALDVFDRLADRSLLATDADDNGDVRYRLLDSVREFGRARLQDNESLDDAELAHATWFATAASRAASGSRGPAQASHLRLLRAERANIDAALTWCATHDPLLGVRIAHGFGWTWAILGAGPDAARRIRTALAAASNVVPSGISEPEVATLRAESLLLACWLEAAGGDLSLAAADLSEARNQGGDSALAQVALVYEAFLRTQQGRPSDVLDLVTTAGPPLQSTGRDWEFAASRLLAAWAHIALGDVPQAAAACEQTLGLFTGLGDDWAVIHADAMLGGLAQAQGDYGRAITHLSRASAAAARLGFDAARALHLSNLGRAQQQNGDPEAAAQTLAAAAEAAVATGDLRLAAQARVALSRVQRSLGRAEQARATARAAQRWFAQAGGGDGELLAAYVLAAIAADLGEPDAHEDLSATRARAQQSGDKEAELLILDALARHSAAAGDAGTAAALLRSADALLPSVRHRVTDLDRIDRITPVPEADAGPHLTRTRSVQAYTDGGHT